MNKLDKLTHLPFTKISWGLDFENDLSFKEAVIQSEHSFYEMGELTTKNKKSLVYVAGKTENSNGIGILISRDLDVNKNTLIKPVNLSIDAIVDYVPIKN